MKIGNQEIRGLGTNKLTYDNTGFGWLELGDKKYCRIVQLESHKRFLTALLETRIENHCDITRYDIYNIKNPDKMYVIHRGYKQEE